MTPAQRLCGLLALTLAAALPACHRRLPRPGKPTATQSVQAAAQAPRGRVRP